MSCSSLVFSSVAEGCVDPMIALRRVRWPETDVTASGGSGLEIYYNILDISVRPQHLKTSEITPPGHGLRLQAVEKTSLQSDHY